LKVLSQSTLQGSVSVTVAAPAGAIAFFDLHRYGLSLAPHEEVDGVFDLDIALAPVKQMRQLVKVNDHCARSVLSHFDMIPARTWNLMLQNPLLPTIVEQGRAHADRA
jgi:hypothetical protein